MGVVYWQRERAIWNNALAVLPNRFRRGGGSSKPTSKSPVKGLLLLLSWGLPSLYGCRGSIFGGVHRSLRRSQEWESDVRCQLHLCLLSGQTSQSTSMISSINGTKPVVSRTNRTAALSDVESDWNSSRVQRKHLN